jgi:hypothetical protein
MQRVIIGTAAGLCVLGAIAFRIWPPETGYWAQVEGACWRMGALLGAWCLAYNEARRLPAWIWAMIPVLVLIIAFRPRWLIVAVPLMLAVALLRPRKR